MRTILVVALLSILMLGCKKETNKETCNDGIQNQNETGIDCGGPCTACEQTPTCSDGIQNQGETGVDCGGPCTACQQAGLLTKKTGYFYHILGSLQGAYDLVNDTLRSSSGSDGDKDFINTDAAGNFTGKWRAGNNTTFVHAPGWQTFNPDDPADMTYEHIDSLYNAGGTPFNFEDNPGTGSNYVYIAKLRGGSEYAVIKFTSRDGSNNDCNCSNLGKYAFTYWKK